MIKYEKKSLRTCVRKLVVGSQIGFQIWSLNMGVSIGMLVAAFRLRSYPHPYGNSHVKGPNLQPNLRPNHQFPDTCS